MSERTPGPWAVSTFAERNSGGALITGVHPAGNDDRWVCRLIANPDFNENVVQANARLIAAAPEMLEALKQALADYPPDTKYNEVERRTNLMIAAIAKAEGRNHG